MRRTVVLGVVFLFLPFGTIGFTHDIVKRAAHDDSHSWGYEDKNGPSDWPKIEKKCGGMRQSPINIDTSEVDLNDQLDNFEFDNYDDPLEDAIIENNGHTIKVSPGPKDVPRTIEKGGMDDEYQFYQLHFHWGARDSRGSEHLIDRKAFPIEMHMVHRNKNYPSVENATKKEDGFAVLGVLFKLDSDDNNPALDPIIEKLETVKKEGAKAKLSDLVLRDILPKHTMPYYRYQGSLTTPPCLEIVTWTLFKEFVPIGEEQLKRFREITEDDKGEDSEPLVDNFRPPQKLNGRVVEISGKSNSASSVGPSVIAILSALSFFL